MKQRYSVLAASLLLMTGMAQAQDIALGGLDDFEDETVQGWVHGGVSPNPPTVIPVGGGGGADDAWLDNISTGNFGAGGRHIILNSDPRWTGDYIAAGVNKIRVNLVNFSADPLNMRVAFRRGGVDCWATTDAVVLAADGVWGNYQFIIDESTMTQVDGSGTFEDALRNVAEIRFLSSADPSCMGDQFAGESGYDDFQTTADTDLDGINDPEDNCTLVANPPVCIGNADIDNAADCALAELSWGQIDSDGDFYGNACDADVEPDIDPPFLSGNCFVDFFDLGAFKASFLTNEGDTNYDQETDLLYNGSIDFFDLGAVKAQFLSAPGPGLGNCGCAPEPSELDPGEDFTGFEMFVRGGLFNEWNAVPQINNAANLGSMTYQARLEVTAGNYGFKFASGDDGWSVEYSADAEVVVNGDSVNFGPGAGVANATVNIPASGCYEFNVTANPVDPPEDPPVPAGSIDIAIVGPLP